MRTLSAVGILIFVAAGCAGRPPRADDLERYLIFGSRVGILTARAEVPKSPDFKEVEEVRESASASTTRLLELLCKERGYQLVTVRPPAPPVDADAQKLCTFAERLGADYLLLPKVTVRVPRQGPTRERIEVTIFNRLAGERIGTIKWSRSTAATSEGKAKPAKEKKK